ncbi:hypothetical protein LINPERPRIM_LOCUS37980 [Linum perenne]
MSWIAILKIMSCVEVMILIS